MYFTFKWTCLSLFKFSSFFLSPQDVSFSSQRWVLFAKTCLIHFVSFIFGDVSESWLKHVWRLNETLLPVPLFTLQSVSAVTPSTGKGRQIHTHHLDSIVSSGDSKSQKPGRRVRPRAWGAGRMKEEEDFLNKALEMLMDKLALNDCLISVVKTFWDKYSRDKSTDTPVLFVL